MQFTAIIYPDTLPSGGPMLTAHCPELDVTTQGETRIEALANLREAVELFLEVADDAEIGRRIRREHEGAIALALEVAA